MHHYFSVKLNTSDDFSDEETDELPSTNEKKDENIEDETINYCNIIYDLNVQCKTACIVDNKNASGDIFIPKFIQHKSQNFSVVSIKNRSFEKAAIKSIEFANDSDVYLIEKDSFINSTIEKIVIPASISDLEEGWCRGTPKLINISIMPNNQRFCYFDETMIIGKKDLIDIEYNTIHFVRRNIEDIIIPSFIQRIASYSFSECLLKNINIPANVTTISEGAFYGCTLLQNVEIPQETNLTAIDKFSFVKTAISEISIPSSVLQLTDFWRDETTKVTFVEVEVENKITSNENEQIEQKGDDLLDFDDLEFQSDNNENDNSICESSDDEMSDEDENDIESSSADKIALNRIIINYSKGDEENKSGFEQSGITQNDENKDKEKSKTNNNGGNDTITQNEDCFANRKSALEWINIGDLILKNRIYLSLTEDEANLAIDELYALILLPFSSLRTKCAFAINKNTEFPNYWSCLRSFKYDGINTFSNISKVASRLYVISASEVDAERAFSKLKWRFDNRRSSIKQKTMVQELHIEHQQQKKIQPNCDFSQLMWEHPEHND